MEYARVKGLNREVSRIGLGTWSIGGFMWGGTDERDALETILTAFRHGINLIDTAPAYGLGRTAGRLLDLGPTLHHRSSVGSTPSRATDADCWHQRMDVGCQRSESYWRNRARVD
jgi:predicted aldo/keto reductase-like oxidoreductase